jgi:hypothetical protein
VEFVAHSAYAMIFNEKVAQLTVDQEYPKRQQWAKKPSCQLTIPFLHYEKSNLRTFQFMLLDKYEFNTFSTIQRFCFQILTILVAKSNLSVYVFYTKKDCVQYTVHFLGYV